VCHIEDKYYPDYMVCIPKTHNVLWLNNTNDYWFVLIMLNWNLPGFVLVSLKGANCNVDIVYI